MSRSRNAKRIAKKEKKKAKLKTTKQGAKSKKPTGAAPQPTKGIFLPALMLGLALLGAVAAVPIFLPRVDVTFSDPVTPDEPFSASVTIANSGYISLGDVTAKIGIGIIAPKDDMPDEETKNTDWDYGAHFVRGRWSHHRLRPGDKFTIALNEVYQDKNHVGLEYADIGIVVDYETPVFTKGQKIFPVIAYKQSNGRFYWYFKPQN